MSGNGENGVDQAAQVEGSEEVLVQIPNAIVHLIDEEESPHLGSGDFSVVKITQQGTALVMLVRVGENLQWPLTKDVPTVKLDPTHYFFTLRVPAEVERQVEKEDGAAEASKDGEGTLNYGVTFPGSGHEGAIEELDKVLEKYTFFSCPKMQNGSGEQKEEMVERAQEAAELKGDERVPSATEIEVATSVTSEDEQEVAEHNQSDFWTTMAPDVDEYNSKVAKSIASGSGQIIRGIFWVSNATVAQLENGSTYIQKNLKPLDRPSEISPRILANVHRARDMTRMTENVAKNILSGVLKTVGFFSGAVINSMIGKKIFQLMPGEVVLVSLDAFGKLFDALEKAGTDIMTTSSLVTQNVIAHRFGPAAGQFTEDTLASAGHVLGTAWTVSKLRKAINPKDGALKPSYTSQAKAAAKAAIHRN